MTDYLRRWALWLGNLLLEWGSSSEIPSYEFCPMSDQESESLRAVFIRDITHPSPSVLSAVQHAFIARGMPMADYSMEFNLRDRGEVYNVLRIAGEHLGVDRGLKTVADVVRVLSEVL